MRKLLTSARAEWAGAHKPRQMKGTRLALPAGVADRYRAKLQFLTDQMTRETQRAYEALWKHDDVQAYLAAHKGVAMDISPASQARILANILIERFVHLFGDHAKAAAESMANQADAASSAALFQSLKDLSGGLSFKTKGVFTPVMREFMKASIAENVSLIKSIPTQYFRKVEGEINRSIISGGGLEQLTKFFEDQHGIESRRAKNIAIDQTHKAYNGLNKGRMQAVGIKAFQWIHSGGGMHPRPLHLDTLNGKTFTFDKLPVIDLDTGERGIPGQAINCRCTMVPVVKFDAEGEPK